MTSPILPGSAPQTAADPFAEQLRRAKLRLLRLHHDAGCGHLGGNFSCLDAVLLLHHEFLRPQDRFLLSKGHSAGALYVALWSTGQLSEAALTTFTRDGTQLPAHPSGNGIPGLSFSTGSLGHGPSLAAGLALGARLRQEDQHIYGLCSDGEWQEGSCWEALSFAVHQKLDNLTLLIDQNGWQGFGRTVDVISCADLTPRLQAFGASVQTLDGHDATALRQALASPAVNGPRVLVLNTRKGHGLDFEDALESHYLPLSTVAFEAARARLEAGKAS